MPGRRPVPPMADEADESEMDAEDPEKDAPEEEDTTPVEVDVVMKVTVKMKAENTINDAMEKALAVCTSKTMTWLGALPVRTAVQDFTWDSPLSAPFETKQIITIDFGCEEEA